MGFRLLAAAWLAFQFTGHGAANADSEGCTNIEEPEIHRGEAALLQAGASKERVVLKQVVDELSDEADPAAAPPAAAPRGPPAPPALQRRPHGSAHAAAPPRPRRHHGRGQPAAEATPPDAPASEATPPRPQEQAVLLEDAAASPAAEAAPPQGPERAVLLEGSASSSSAGSQDAESAGWLSLARVSVVSLARFVRERLPTSLVLSFPSLQTDVGAAFGLILATWFIWYTLVALTACVYRSNKSFPVAVSSRPEQDFNDWTSGPFDCSSDSMVWGWSCCCPCIRWADSMDMLGIVGFWVGLSLFCGLVLLTTVPGGLLLWAVATLLWVSFRQQLRVKFDMEQNTFKTFASDCALYCCCWACAIAQEARHIEEACRAAHKAVRKHESA